MEQLHQPVLLTEVLAALQPQPGEAYLDLTAGYAGHAKEILDVTQNYKLAVLVDRDEFAIEHLRREFASTPVELVNSDFYSAARQLVECERTFDLILADFGVSSPQLDMAGRGFSFIHDGPLDMRMDQSQALTAATVVNKWSKRELEEILVKYGEISSGLAAKYARVIVQGRPWQSTGQLAAAIGSKHYGKTHPATRVFQAVRIVVNDELNLIEKTLPLIPKLLNPGGRVVLITFHSLEDRLVKQYLKQASSYGQESELELLTRKPVVAEKSEVVINPRARSAKLRAAKRR